MVKDKKDIAELHGNTKALQKELFALRDEYINRVRQGLPSGEVIEQQRIIAAMLNLRYLPVGDE